jgi:transposase
MAGNMARIVKNSFSNATLVIDRFHVQKLALNALQEQYLYIIRTYSTTLTIEVQTPQLNLSILKKSL